MARVAAPARKQKAQGGPTEDPTTTMTSAPGSELADRALRGVARKLSRDLSVEYTVNELMREAKDTYNLANIFVGAQIFSRQRGFYGADVLTCPQDGNRGCDGRVEDLS